MAINQKLIIIINKQMNIQNDEFINASNQYFRMLNAVNLLLLKEHALLLEKKQYEEQITQVDRLIAHLQTNEVPNSNISLESEFNFLHSSIIKNKKEIGQLSSKLQNKQTMINQLTELTQRRKKFQKLIDTEYQNGIQQKLSMIRGKVDDLKKKIKEINKDILAYEQQHSELIDQYSFQIKTYQCYKERNRQMQHEIDKLKAEKNNHRKH